MPRLVKLYIRNVLIGFAIAAVYVTLLLWMNVANLSHLILGSDVWAVALFMFWFFHGIVFAGVQFAWVVMSMAEKSEADGPRGGNPELVVRPVPVAAHAQKQRRFG